MVRSRTWPSPGVGSAQSSRRKSDGFGSPTGRETRTTRFADWAMAVSSGFLLFVIASAAKQSIVATNGLLRRLAPRNDGFELSRDFRQRRVERRGGARQILEGEHMPRLLGVLFRGTRPHFRKALAAVD